MNYPANSYPMYSAPTGFPYMNNYGYGMNFMNPNEMGEENSELNSYYKLNPNMNKDLEDQSNESYQKYMNSFMTSKPEEPKVHNYDYGYDPNFKDYTGNDRKNLK